jgi:hypothetical protein
VIGAGGNQAGTVGFHQQAVVGQAAQYRQAGETTSGMQVQAGDVLQQLGAVAAAGGLPASCGWRSVLPSAWL